MRGLHPSEQETGRRLRRAFEGPTESSRPGLPYCEIERDLRGFRLLKGAGLRGALTEALTNAREGGTAAPMLLLLQV